MIFFLLILFVFAAPFLFVFFMVVKGAKKKGPAAPKKPQRVHSRREELQPYDPATNTADYPSACQASYNPVRAKDQLDTLLKAGHITNEEYRLRIEQLKNYRHC